MPEGGQWVLQGPEPTPCNNNRESPQITATSINFECYRSICSVHILLFWTLIGGSGLKYAPYVGL